MPRVAGGARAMHPAASAVTPLAVPAARVPTGDLPDTYPFGL